MWWLTHSFILFVFLRDFWGGDVNGTFDILAVPFAELFLKDVIVLELGFEPGISLTENVEFVKSNNIFNCSNSKTHKYSSEGF